MTGSLGADDAEELTRYGRFAITLPLSQTYSGVPYIRAVRRALSPARSSARSTRAASFGFLLELLLLFPLSAFTGLTLSASAAAGIVIYRPGVRLLVFATQTFLCGAARVLSLRPRTSSPPFGGVAAAAERSRS